MFRHILILLTVLSVCAGVLFATSAQAAPIAGAFSAGSGDRPSHYVIKARSSCSYWARKCERSSDYDYCMWRERCENWRPRRPAYRPEYYRRANPNRNQCRAWHSECVARWGENYNDYFGCMKYHRCDPRYYNPGKRYSPGRYRPTRYWRDGHYW